MSRPLARLTEEVLALPKASRTRLARVLAESLAPPGADVSAADWEKEVARRVTDLVEGRTKPIPLAEVVQRIGRRSR